MSSFQEFGIEGSTVYRGVLISGVRIEEFHCIQRCPHFRGWNREMSSFQGVGIEEFHCIQRCPHFRELEFHCIQRCPRWNRGVPLYTEGVLISGSWNRGDTEMSSFQGVGIEEFHCIQRCPHFRGLE